MDDSLGSLALKQSFVWVQKSIDVVGTYMQRFSIGPMPQQPVAKCSFFQQFV
jgi:hypothetical protein